RFNNRFRKIRWLIRLLRITEGKCAYCAVSLTWNFTHPRLNPAPTDLTIDHVVPRALMKAADPQGKFSISNLLPCCFRCNSSKGDKTYIEEWMPEW
ncbi:MAG: HNH endonuclease, partial [Nitrososphaera sp.]|nr:HNH endonuclease [Nitrososphaera sp.]